MQDSLIKETDNELSNVAEGTAESRSAERPYIIQMQETCRFYSTINLRLIANTSYIMKILNIASLHEYLALWSRSIVVKFPLLAHRTND